MLRPFFRASCTPLACPVGSRNNITAGYLRIAGPKVELLAMSGATPREFAAVEAEERRVLEERLAAIRARHARYYTELAERADLRGPGQREWLPRPDAESANLRVAPDKVAEPTRRRVERVVAAVGYIPNLVASALAAARSAGANSGASSTARSTTRTPSTPAAFARRANCASPMLSIGFR